MEVSDVSDVELVDTVNTMEKALEVEQKNSFEIFQLNRRRRACTSHKTDPVEEKLHLNPLGLNKRWLNLGKEGGYMNTTILSA